MKFLKEILIAKKKGLGNIKAGLEGVRNAGYGNNTDGSMQDMLQA